jgi:hypothetical protein
MGVFALLHNIMELSDIPARAFASAAFSLVVDIIALTISGIGLYVSVQNLQYQGE